MKRMIKWIRLLIIAGSAVVSFVAVLYYCCQIPAGRDDRPLMESGRNIDFTIEALMPSFQRSVIHEDNAIRVVFLRDHEVSAIVSLRLVDGEATVTSVSLFGFRVLRKFTSSVQIADWAQIRERLDRAGFWSKKRRRPSVGGRQILGTWDVMIEASIDGRYANWHAQEPDEFAEMIGLMLALGGLDDLKLAWDEEMRLYQRSIRRVEIGSASSP